MKLLNKFDDKVGFVLYFEHEQEANDALVDHAMLEKFRDELYRTLSGQTNAVLRQMHEYNSGQQFGRDYGRGVV